MPFPKIFCHLNFQLKNRNGSNECSRFMRREKRNWEGKGLETRWRESNRRIFFTIHKMPNADSVTTVASGYAFHLMESVRNLVHQSQIYIDCSHYSMWRGFSFWIEHKTTEWVGMGLFRYVHFSPYPSPQIFGMLLKMTAEQITLRSNSVDTRENRGLWMLWVR